MTLDVNDPRVTSPTISTVDDVRAWFDALLSAGVNFHPEDKFQGVIDGGTGEPTWPRPVAVRMDVLMTRGVYPVCKRAGVDPCRVASEAFEAHFAKRAE